MEYLRSYHPHLTESDIKTVH